MRYTPQMGALATLLNVDWREVTKHSKNLYEWRHIYYEIVSYKKKTAPASHYTTLKKGITTWSLREIGNKSKLMTTIKKGKDA